MNGYFDREKYKQMLGIYIREQREAQNLSLAEISRRTGISPSRLKRIEEGKVLITARTMANLSSSLNLNESHLIKIQEVAHTAYVNELLHTLNSTEAAHNDTAP